MIRYLRILFIALTGIALLVLALANRGPVTLRLVPDELATMLGMGLAYDMPLFLVILGSVAAGVLIGFVWEWFRERGIRGDARARAREVARLERELAELRQTGPVAAQDDVLALLDGASGRR